MSEADEVPICEKCKDKAIFQIEGGFYITNAYYPPTYNSKGINTNPDGNTSTGVIRCTACGTKWKMITQFKKTSFIKEEEL